MKKATLARDKGEPISVPKEVAEFLEQDRKRSDPRRIQDGNLKAAEESSQRTEESRLVTGSLFFCCLIYFFQIPVYKWCACGEIMPRLPVISSR